MPCGLAMRTCGFQYHAYSGTVVADSPFNVAHLAQREAAR